MPRKHSQQPEYFAGDPRDPQGMHVLLRAYVDSLRVRNYAEGTIQKRRRQINDFILWCALRTLTQPAEITRQFLERYQQHLFYSTDKRGRPRSFRDQHTRLCSLRAWFKWLTQKRHVELNPASELELPKLGHRLPRHVLSLSEVETVINLPDVSEPLGIRDRAMLETLYSTGIRRMELAGLRLEDLDTERGVLTVRQGKGRKDRVIPIGARALAWTEKYRHQVRPRLLVDTSQTVLYLTRLGEPFSGSSLSVLVRNYVARAELGKTGSCHLFRHTMATLMHENGADIRFIQAMLGHVKLDTTEIYTQVSIRKLKEVHDATHPARLERKSQGKDPNGPTPPAEDDSLVDE